MTTSLNPQKIDESFIKRCQESFLASSKGAGPVTLTYISDNGNYADLARAEIEKRLMDIAAVISAQYNLPDLRILYHDIPSQDWRAGAFDLAQLSRDTVRGPGNVIFLNCAPRLKQRGVEKDNKGENVYLGMLPNGTVVAAVSEHSFVLFSDLLKTNKMELYPVSVQTKGSQFRSRDYFTWFAQVLAFNLQMRADKWLPDMNVDERRAFLSDLNFIETDKPIDPQHIQNLSDLPQIIRADTHGNLKTSLRKGQIDPSLFGEDLDFQLFSQEGRSLSAIFAARVVHNMFDTPSGKTGFAPGSSGNWPDYDADGKQFMELAYIGYSMREGHRLSHDDLKRGVFLNAKQSGHDEWLFGNPEFRA